MAPAARQPTASSASRALGALTVLSALVAAGYLLWPEPLADAFFAGWVVGSVVVALVGGVAAWTARTALAWVAALLLSAVAVVGMWSIGLFVAPAAACLLGAAALSPRTGPPPGVRAAVLADPPTTRETALRALAGLGAVALGAWLAYRGAVARELFGACARETLACAVAATHWDAVGVTLVGLLAVGLGARLVWRQLAISRVLASAGDG